ncbi:MAG TPA: hypothetical protein VNW29_01630 [Candidatus Sulfotelmatobacter sp.]|jgi:hypothetical protein|nr:hypothetical protein [Candidatus Sulfotelmatobacter sp.]
MAFNPFSNSGEDTSFEQGTPISQVAKTVTKQTSTQTTAQMKAVNNAIVDQLSGSVSSGQDQGSDVLSKAQGGTTAGVQSNSANTTQSSEEQAKMEKIRRELFVNYGSKFKSAQNGPFGIRTDIEQGMEKARQERRQKEQQRKQEEEEEKRRREEEKKTEQEEFLSPAGKKAGVMFGKKPQKPLAVHLAKIKTEGNRGTSG